MFEVIKLSKDRELSKVWLRRISSSLRRQCLSLRMNLFVFVHFHLPNMKFSRQMMFFGNRCQRTLWRHLLCITTQRLGNLEEEWHKLLQPRRTLKAIACPFQDYCVQANASQYFVSPSAKRDHNVDHCQREWKTSRA